jgi:carboxypeptidase PM20D1
MTWAKAITMGVALSGSGAISAAPPATKAMAIDILGKSVAYRTVEGQGQVPAYAAYLSGVLTRAGYDAKDIQIDRHGETATLIARYPGTGKGRPILISAHMDVVEAIAKDWTRDPFTMIEENGNYYGRGVLDNKFDLSMIVATMARLKSEGFKPKRDIILAFSGDEETSQTTTQFLVKKFPNAEMILNGDAGGGNLGDDNKPVAYYVQAAEKTYADFEIRFTNPGGHSSLPRKDNAIYALAKAVDKISAFEFPVQISDITRAYFKETAVRTPGSLGEAMKRFAINPEDAAAASILGAQPEYVGQVRTTCVATMLKGGHAENALPQSAAVNINCRIFPGVAVESVRAKLQEVIVDPAATIALVSGGVVSDASPLRPDVMKALRKSVDKRNAGLTIVPEMSAGATDSLFFRNAGMPSYGVAGLFMKPNEIYAHGLNERVPTAAVDGALDHWHSILTDLAK